MPISLPVLILARLALISAVAAQPAFLYPATPLLVNPCPPGTVPHLLHPAGCVRCHGPGTGVVGVGGRGMPAAPTGADAGATPATPAPQQPQQPLASSLAPAPAPGAAPALPASRRRRLMAPEADTPYAALAGDGSLGVARGIVDKAGSAGDALKSGGELTLLAPTDAALGALLAKHSAAGRAPAAAAGRAADVAATTPPALARRLVQLHTIPGVRLSSLPVGVHTLKTAGGSDVVVYVKSAAMAPRIEFGSSEGGGGSQDAEVVGTLRTKSGGEVAVINGAFVPSGVM